jgi:hypothetical protein
LNQRAVRPVELIPLVNEKNFHWHLKSGCLEVAQCPPD